MKRILWSPKALRQLRKVKDQQTRIRIYDAVEALKGFPKCSNIKKLRSRGEYRLRIKLWRVIFRESQDYLYIEEVKKRDEHTY